VKPICISEQTIHTHTYMHFASQYLPISLEKSFLVNLQRICLKQLQVYFLLFCQLSRASKLLCASISSSVKCENWTRKSLKSFSALSSVFLWIYEITGSVLIITWCWDELNCLPIDVNCGSPLNFQFLAYT
jgi:hypothetical protein